MNLLTSSDLARLSVVLGLVAINAVADATIDRNTAVGVYPATSDEAALSQLHFWSLSVPGMFGLAVLSVGGMFARWLGGPREPFLARLAFMTLVALGYLCATLYFVAWGLGWWEPNYRAISLAVWLLAFLVAWLGWLETLSIQRGRANAVSLPKWFD